MGNRNINFKTLFSDIRFWIIIFFLIRLIGITNAPLEIGHNWRQSLTNMIARNFLEINSNILYPRIDMAGNLTGIIGSEFPVFNYIIYLFSLVFDYSHWYGRLINLVVSSFGIFYFYKLISKATDNKTLAFNSTIILLSSIWFAFSRKIMPDTFSISLVIIGFYYGYRYFETGSILSILIYFILVTLGVLSKIPALSLMSAAPIIFIIKEIPLKRKLIFLACSIVSLLLVFAWYFYWVPYLVNTYHYQLYFPKGITEGINEIKNYMPQFFEKFYFSALNSYLAFIFFLIGIYIFIKNGSKYMKICITAITIVFFIFIIKTGFVFPTHNYYIIPFVPIMCLLAGYGLTIVPKKILFVALLFINIEGIANQQHDLFVKNSMKYKLTLEKIADKYINRKDLVIINGGLSPQDMYFLHRRGWSLESAQLNVNKVDSLAKEGAKFFVIDKNKDSVYYNGNILYSDKNYDIYKLNDEKK